MFVVDLYVGGETVHRISEITGVSPGMVCNLARGQGLVMRGLYMRRIESFNLATGTIVKRYDSLNDAAEDGHCLTSMWHVANGRRKSHKGLGWRYSY